MTISIICTNKDPEPWVAALRALDPTLDVQIWPNESRKADVEFALCWHHPKGVLRDYQNLRCICSMGAGIDHLLNDEFLPKDLPVIRIIDPLLAQSMYEYLHTAVMYYFRDFDIYKTQQYQSTWKQQLPKSIAHTTIGVMGLGKLGEYSASKFSEIGFNVIGWSRTQKTITGVKSYTGDRQLEEFLSQVDILICLLPLTNETRGILNLENFSKLPSGACLVNVARGEHVMDEDLITAINQGQLRGACLDVFREEPLPQTHPFWQHNKILLTPHCSSITDPNSVAPQILENYRLMKSGRPLMNQVNLVRGY
ncbi:glyoxylate/hydroxypyruvate reductase A [Marinobacter antarcticus]|uniref:Glyoxylate/hydroxypyruvate reductase A n=1 Tax=Marinobacter antarcticus TaxID=564117 RepID=A0A1M6R472_9GAMM|nr:glyoxylate/hydroxypyruvate reductase A [Marinobacter antarcticus]SHK27137.1 glyoxylate/hydroxypyruvate reductase A [Marinobacter antarcticus]